MRELHVGVSPQLEGAELHELGEVKVHGLITERQESFDARGGGRVKLDGVGEGREIITGSGWGAEVGENVVVAVAAALKARLK